MQLSDKHLAANRDTQPAKQANKGRKPPEKNAGATRTQFSEQNKGLNKTVEPVQAPHGPKKWHLLTQ